MKRTASFRALAVVVAACVVPAPAICAAESNATAGTAELTPETERAIEKGLEWLIKTQNEDGSWGTYKTASTALGLMAFMVKGYFPERPPHGENLSKAVDFLLRQSQTQRGYMGTSMYEHGLATLALSEVWGMSNRAGIREALKLAVDVILRAQNPQGGWRYNPAPTDADISVTVMQVVALASAKEAGIFVPDTTIQKAVAYVTSCQHQQTGGFAYQPGGGPGFARTAAGVMSLMMCGRRDSDAAKRGRDYLINQPQNVFESADGYYHYAHYYAIQAMYQAGDEYYQQWYPKIRDSLLKKQAAEGNWPGGHGIGTQMAILILGVPYRFLPIYQR